MFSLHRSSSSNRDWCVFMFVGTTPPQCPNVLRQTVRVHTARVYYLTL